METSSVIEITSLAIIKTETNVVDRIMETGDITSVVVRLLEVNPIFRTKEDAQGLPFVTTLVILTPEIPRTTTTTITTTPSHRLYKSFTLPQHKSKKTSSIIETTTGKKKKNVTHHHLLNQGITPRIWRSCSKLKLGCEQIAFLLKTKPSHKSSRQLKIEELSMSLLSIQTTRQQDAFH